VRIRRASLYLYANISSYIFSRYQRRSLPHWQQVIGGTTFIGQEESIFLKETQTLWTRDGNGSNLAGKHIWPFTFALPNQVEVKSGAVTGKHTLPPTFTERASTTYVDYRLLVEIKRGGFLKVDKT
jgi:hypothetical protein